MSVKWLLSTTSTSLFVVDRMTIFLFTSLTSIIFKHKHIQVPFSDAVTPQQPSLIISQGQITSCYSASEDGSLHLGSSSMIILDTEFQPVDASPLG